MIGVRGTAILHMVMQKSMKQIRIMLETRNLIFVISADGPSVIVSQIWCHFLIQFSRVKFPHYEKLTYVTKSV